MPDPISAFVVLWAFISSLGWTSSTSGTEEIRAKLNEIEAQVVSLQKTVDNQKVKIEGLENNVTALEAENENLHRALALSRREAELAVKTIGNLVLENHLLRRNNSVLAESYEGLDEWANDAEVQISAMRLEREKRDSLVLLGRKSAYKVLDLEKKLKTLDGKLSATKLNLYTTGENLAQTQNVLKNTLKELDHWKEKALLLEKTTQNIKMWLTTIIVIFIITLTVGIFYILHLWNKRNGNHSQLATLD